MYHASIEIEDCIHFYGVGNTPEEALEDFLSGGEFIEACEYLEIDSDDVEVSVYSVISTEDADLEEGSFEEEWTWLLDEIVTTKVVAVV
jgi:hypothetical protein